MTATHRNSTISLTRAADKPPGDLHVATVVNRQTVSDAELIAASRTGDADAYGELYRRHLPAARAAMIAAMGFTLDLS